MTNETRDNLILALGEALDTEFHAEEQRDQLLATWHILPTDDLVDRRRREIGDQELRRAFARQRADFLVGQALNSPTMYQADEDESS